MARPKTSSSTKRHDPEPAADVDDAWGIIDADPERAYVWVNATSKDSMLSYRLGGYTPVLWEYTQGEEGPTGPRPFVTVSTEDRPRHGAEIRSGENILMSIDKASLTAARAKGRNGLGLGSEHVSKLEDRMTSPNAFDKFRGGLRHPGITVTPYHDGGNPHNVFVPDK